MLSEMTLRKNSAIKASSLALEQEAFNFVDLEERSPSRAQPKTWGAFYTEQHVADFLVWWALRNPSGKALDPSFGGGVFLQSACRRLRSLGKKSTPEIFGVELDPEVFQEVSGRLRREYRLLPGHLLRADFFDVLPSQWGKLDCLIGNPPFIRYQKFKGEKRQKALLRAERAGVKLNGLASSWAHFLIHGMNFLAPGGRLAMVVPAEIVHASYAKPVLRYLERSFGKVIFLTFQRKLFSRLSEDTLLLLAENYGQASSKIYWQDFSDSGRLINLIEKDQFHWRGLKRVDGHFLSSGQGRLWESLLPKKVIALYRELVASAEVQRLGDWADVGIGYVSGGNHFFHLNCFDVQAHHLPDEFLKPMVNRGRDLEGLFYTHQDWTNDAKLGRPCFLLYLPSNGILPRNVKNYLKLGTDQGVDQAYKCRTRTPWYRVPHVYVADAFLTYMSGSSSKMVANSARAVAPNSLHIVRIKGSNDISAAGLASLWKTSLAKLGAELEGHSLGGGMLKLEPSEAERVPLPAWTPAKSKQVQLARELDALCRKRQEQKAQGLADKIVLCDFLGLTVQECVALSRGAKLLRERRYGRGASS